MCGVHGVSMTFFYGWGCLGWWVCRSSFLVGFVGWLKVGRFFMEVLFFQLLGFFPFPNYAWLFRFMAQVTFFHLLGVRTRFSATSLVLVAVL